MNSHSESINVEFENEFDMTKPGVKNDYFNSDIEIENKEIIFRNYYPINEDFRIEKNNYFQLIKETEQKIEGKVLNDVKNFLNLEKNPLNIIPDKNNIDLKRNISDKLQILNKQTEIAISEIIKENVEKKKKSENA